MYVRLKIERKINEVCFMLWTIKEKTFVHFNSFIDSFRDITICMHNYTVCIIYVYFMEEMVFE
jgi:hypothetical protein